MSLELYNVSKKYKKRNIIKNLNIKFSDTGLAVVRGNTGCGKSTLLKIIAGIEKCNSGFVKYDGQKIKTNNAKYYKDNITYVSQDFCLFEEMSVYDNLKLLCDINDVKDIDSTIKNIKEKLHFTKNDNVLVSNLSSGEKNKLALSLLLIMPKKIILIDEPTANLDEENSKIIENLIIEFSKNHLIIVSSHDNKLFLDNNLSINFSLGDCNVVYSDLKCSSVVESHQVKYKKPNKTIYLKLFDFSLQKIIVTIFFTLSLVLFFLSMLYANKTKEVNYDNMYDFDDYRMKDKETSSIEALINGYDNGLVDKCFRSNSYSASFYYYLNSSIVYKYDETINCYPFEYIENDLIIEGAIESDKCVIGKGLADKLISVTNNRLNYKTLIGCKLFGYKEISGITSKNTLCCYMNFGIYSEYIDYISKNKEVGYARAFNYEIISGVDAYDDKLIINERYYNTYPEEDRADLNYCGIFRVADETDCCFEYLTLDKAKYKQKSPSFFNYLDVSTFSGDIIIGRMPTTSKEILMPIYGGYYIDDNYLGYKVVGLYNSYDSEYSYITSEGIKRYEDIGFLLYANFQKHTAFEYCNKALIRINDDTALDNLNIFNEYDLCKMYNETGYNEIDLFVCLIIIFIVEVIIVLVLNTLYTIKNKDNINKLKILGIERRTILFEMYSKKYVYSLIGIIGCEIIIGLLYTLLCNHINYSYNVFMNPKIYLICLAPLVLLTFLYNIYSLFQIRRER